MDGNDRARRILIAACLLSLLAALLPREGVATDVVSASFWLYSAAIVAFAVHQLVLLRRHGEAVPVLKWCLLAVCLVSLFVSAALERGTPTALALAWVSIGALVWLVVLAARDALRGVRVRRAATFPPHGGKSRRASAGRRRAVAYGYVFCLCRNATSIAGAARPM
jgi:O-antigen/teichoic acid export membrane protein